MEALRVQGVAYPERLIPHLGKVEEWVERAAGPVARRWRGVVAGQRNWVQRVTAAGEDYASPSDADLRRAAQELRVPLLREGFSRPVVARTFALVREAAQRTIGQRHFDVQLLGGWILLTGRVAEMETGEGKTLTATLPAITAALAGVPVHIVTVNDYLAARDAEMMAPIYHALGLTVGVVTHGMDPPAHRAAYACDVAYCTNKELVFDYLKDRLQLGQLATRNHLQLQRLYRQQAAGDVLLRGLHYAIVDEADSVLIDEARTPLIIARAGSESNERDVYGQALRIACLLVEHREFVLDRSEREVRLTPEGKDRIAELSRPLGGVWQGRRRREAYLVQALTALHLFHREKQYLVQDAKIHIIDEYTGRLMSDRSWERGLHQMIEVKEGCPLSDRQETLARISYQRFFRRYLRLAGMTGTAREVAGELWSVYRLGVVRIPTNRPLRRHQMPNRVYPTSAAKWQAIVQAIVEARQQGRPVLIGTRTVAASDHLSSLLTHAGILHDVLNARQDQKEATIIARAAEPGRITVATNMAGRGTDIKLASGVADIGGLHVIATERHEAHRIDRQLFGRCGRQGDPGTCHAMVSLEDELITAYAGRFGRWVAWRAGRGHRPLPQWLGEALFHVVQRRAERMHARMRWAVLKMDEQIETALAFAGRSE